VIEAGGHTVGFTLPRVRSRQVQMGFYLHVRILGRKNRIDTLFFIRNQIKRKNHNCHITITLLHYLVVYR